jgi:hypothetical protein
MQKLGYFHRLDSDMFTFSLSALKWVAPQVDKSDRPSVVHVSIHGNLSDAVDEATATVSLSLNKGFNFNLLTTLLACRQGSACRSKLPQIKWIFKGNST